MLFYTPLLIPTICGIGALVFRNTAPSVHQLIAALAFTLSNHLCHYLGPHYLRENVTVATPLFVVLILSTLLILYFQPAKATLHPGVGILQLVMLLASVFFITQHFTPLPKYLN